MLHSTNTHIGTKEEGRRFFMKSHLYRLEVLLETDGTKKDIALLVISSSSLLLKSLQSVDFV